MSSREPEGGGLRGRNADPADDEAQAIERLAMQLMLRGLDWHTAVLEATRRARGGPAARGGAPRTSPGKVARTRDLRAPIQARGLDGDEADDADELRDAADDALSGTAGLLPYLDEIQAAFGHHDVTGVRAHTDGTADRAVREMGAEAFASGTEVAFAGTPSLYTAAHEAAHVVQQRGGVDVPGGVGRAGDRHERHADEVAERVVSGRSAVDLLDEVAPTPREAPSRGGAIQLRRIPADVQALLEAVGGGADGPNFAANAAGVERLIARAMASLTAPQRASVLVARRAGLADEAAFLALPQREQLWRHANAIIAEVGARRLGDPALINSTPTDAASIANIGHLVTNANTRFAAAIAGTYNTHLDSVFGAAHRATAIARYTAGRTRMNELHALPNGIVTDGSGYNAEAGLGGLTNRNRISLSPGIIASPHANGSVITMVHESMHAGNPGVVTDRGYLLSPGFEIMSPTDKLGNAAHYEVPLWRVMEPANDRAYPHPTPPPDFREFTPPGVAPVSGGPPPPAPTISEQGVRAASEVFRMAWTIALNLHNVYQRLYTTPTAWTTPQADFGSMALNTSVPFWSKVCMLTVHLKTTINPASANPAERPISQIDMALSEGVVRAMSQARNLLRPLQTDAQVQAFETANATPAELAAAFPGGVHSDANAERDLLIKLALRSPTVGEVTGPPDRDFRVANRLGATTMAWSDILAVRDPATFT